MRDFVTALNQTWQRQAFSELAGFYHPETILLPPDGGDPIVGFTEVLDTYRQFHETAKLNNFEMQHLQIFEFAHNSFCHMNFSMDYEIGDVRYVEAGLEVYCLEIAPKLQIIWRKQTLLDSEQIIPQTE